MAKFRKTFQGHSWDKTIQSVDTQTFLIVKNLLILKLEFSELIRFLDTDLDLIKSIPFHSGLKEKNNCKG